MSKLLKKLLAFTLWCVIFLGFNEDFVQVPGFKSLRVQGLIGKAYCEWKPTGDISQGKTGFQNCLLTDGRVMIYGGSAGSGEVSTYEIFDPATGAWTSGTGPVPSSHSLGILLPNGSVLFIIISTGQSYIYDPILDIWTPAASFGTWYDRGLATLLKEGLVLSMEFDASNPTRCVLYDYVSNSIISTSSTNYPHNSGIEVLLPSGEVLLAGGANYTVGSRRTEIYNPASGVWTVRGDMNVDRTQFVGILLPPPWNKVLVASNYSSTPQTELFDIATGLWSYTTGSLNHSDRDTPCMVMLPCGSPMIIGGGVNSSSVSRRAEIFDPTSQSWTYTDPMRSPRSHFGAVVLHTGKVLAISGYDSVGFATARTPTCDIYDSCVSEWQLQVPLCYFRKYHTATLLPIIHTTNCSTNVLITGGESGSGYLKSVELYNYIEDQVALTGDLNHARSGHTTVLLASGKPLAVGGKNTSGVLNSCELYDALTETWSLTGSLSQARFDHTATLLRDGRVLVTGGEDGVGYLNSAEIYDPVSGTWTATGNLSTSRARHTASLLIDGRVLVSGGENSGGVLSSCEIWDPTSGVWGATGNLITARSNHSGVLLQSGKVMVIGGKGVGGIPLSQCEVYNPSTGTWEVEASLNHARYNHNACLTYSGLVLVNGGTDGIMSLSSCELYDPAIRIGAVGEWKLTAPLGTPRAGHSSCVIPAEKPFVLTFGGENSGGVLKSVEQYDIGLGYMSEWQSVITSHPAVTQITSPMNIEGYLFRGVTEADGGNHCHITSSDHPIISLLRIGGGNFQNNGGGEMLIMPPSSNWDETHTTVHPATNAPQGYYALWSIVNGIPCKWYQECPPGVERRKTQAAKRKTQISVYPNPSAGVIYIKGLDGKRKTQDASIQIYDCAGGLVKEYSIRYPVSSIKLDGLNSGIYFYRIKEEGTEVKGKFTIIR